MPPLQPLQKTQLQPPFSPSVDSLCHPCITTTHLSYSVLSLKLSATALCGTTGTSMGYSNHSGWTASLRPEPLVKKKLIQDPTQ